MWARSVAQSIAGETRYDNETATRLASYDMRTTVSSYFTYGVSPLSLLDISASSGIFDDGCNESERQEHFDYGEN